MITWVSEQPTSYEMITLSNMIPVEDKDGECVAQQAHSAHHRYQSFLKNGFGPLHHS